MCSRFCMVLGDHWHPHSVEVRWRYWLRVYVCHRTSRTPNGEVWRKVSKEKQKIKKEKEVERKSGGTREADLRPQSIEGCSLILSSCSGRCAAKTSREDGASVGESFCQRLHTDDGIDVVPSHPTEESCHTRIVGPTAPRSLSLVHHLRSKRLPEVLLRVRRSCRTRGVDRYIGPFPDRSRK